MPELVSQPTRMSLPMLTLGVAAGVVLTATLGLWAYYGTAVFFEIVRAGWAACF